MSHMVVINHPSSPIIRSSGLPPWFLNGMGWLVRWLRLDRVAAGVTDAVLPTVPTIEHLITAEAGGEPRIRGEGRFLSSACRALTHGCPQW